MTNKREAETKIIVSWIMGKKTKRTSAKLHVMLENNQDFLNVDAKGLTWY